MARKLQRTPEMVLPLLLLLAGLGPGPGPGGHPGHLSAAQLAVKPTRGPHPASPCPDVFSYEGREPEKNRWYGVVLVNTQEPLEGLRLNIKLDHRAQILGNDVGEVSSSDNVDFTILNLKLKLDPGPPKPVRIFAAFGDRDDIPYIDTIKLNGRTICTVAHEEGVSRPFASRPHVVPAPSGARPAPNQPASKPTSSRPQYHEDEHEDAAPQAHEDTRPRPRPTSPRPVTTPRPNTSPRPNNAQRPNNPPRPNSTPRPAPVYVRPPSSSDNNYYPPNSVSNEAPITKKPRPDSKYTTSTTERGVYQSPRTTTSRYSPPPREEPSQTWPTSKVPAEVNHGQSSSNDQNRPEYTSDLVPNQGGGGSQGFNQGSNTNQGFNQGSNIPSNQGFNHGSSSSSNNHNNNNNQGFDQGSNVPSNQGFNQGSSNNNNNQGFNPGSSSNNNNNQDFIPDSNRNQGYNPGSTASSSSNNNQGSNHNQGFNSGGNIPSNSNHGFNQGHSNQGLGLDNSNQGFNPSGGSGSSNPVREDRVPARPRPIRQANCGRIAPLLPRPSPLIVQGETSLPGKWPWHVALYKPNGRDWKYQCGGTLISPTVVVTAAHCVTRSGGHPVNEDSILVFLGKHKLAAGSEDGVQDKHVYFIHVHPNYNHTNYRNDIAVLILSSPAAITDTVRPACIWDRDKTDLSYVENKFGTVVGWRTDTSVADDQDKVVGWGIENDGLLTEELHQAEMPVVSTVACIYSYPAFFSQYTNEMTFCAGFKPDQQGAGTSVCNGDSGGGMFFKNDERLSDHEAVWMLRGLVSLSVRKENDRCDPSHFVIFTDVAKYIDWIQSFLP